MPLLPPHIRAIQRRDAALARLQHVNGLLIAGSVALTGALAAVAANAFPGRTIQTQHTSKAWAEQSTRLLGPLRPPERSPAESETEPQATPQAEPEAAPEPEPEAAPEPEPEAAPEPEFIEEPVVSGGS